MPAGPARCCSLMTCGAISVGLTTPSTPPRTVCSARWEATARTSEDLTQLRIVMMSRASIEQAKAFDGAAQDQRDEAFTVLTHASQRTNTKLRDVAAELVRTGTLASEG